MAIGNQKRADPRRQRFAELRAEGYSQKAAAVEIGVNYNTTFKWDHEPEVRELVEDIVHARRASLIAKCGEMLAKRLDDDTLDDRAIIDLYKSGFKTPASWRSRRPDEAVSPSIDVHLTIRIIMEAVAVRMGMSPEDASNAVAEAERIMAGILAVPARTKGAEDEDDGAEDADA